MWNDFGNYRNDIDISEMLPFLLVTAVPAHASFAVPHVMIDFDDESKPDQKQEFRCNPLCSISVTH